MDTAQGVPKLVGHDAGELIVSGLVVEPAEVHCRLVLGNIAGIGANAGPGTTWGDRHADVGVAAGDEIE